MHIFTEHGLLRPVLTTITSNHPEFRSGPQPRPCKQLWWQKKSSFYFVRNIKTCTKNMFPCFPSAKHIFSIFFLKKKCTNIFFHVFLLQKIFFHFLFFLKIKKVQKYIFPCFPSAKNIFPFFIFFKNKKSAKKYFSQNCMTKLMRFLHFFAEFHRVCYMHFSELYVANLMKFSKQ